MLLNKTGEDGETQDVVDIGPHLRSFREFAMNLPPDLRGEVLSNSEEIRTAHNSFARSAPFADETQRRPDEGDDAFHFIAYTPVRGTLYELDGLQPAPISHGACSAAEFPTRVMEVLQRRVARYDATEIRFNLLAVVRDLRARAREVGDAEMLAREERKRREWRFENALRKHNFVGFSGEVLKAVVGAKLAQGEGGYEGWVEGAKAKMRRRIEERKRGTDDGGEDVQMAD